MIEYEEEWLAALLFRIKGSVLGRSGIFATFSAILCALLKYLDEWAPGLREDLGLFALNSSPIWNAGIVVVAALLGFRTRMGLKRFWEGTGLLHQMRGEWFDTVSNCITFSINARKTKTEQVDHFRHCLVRLMSRCHASALEEIAENSAHLEGINTFGLDNGTLTHIKECTEVHGFNKVEVMLHLIQSLVKKALDDGTIDIPPPVLSRVFQTLSRGFVNLLNAKKIVDTRFPFPYAVVISFLLMVHLVFTPLVMSAQVQSKVFAAFLTFSIILGLFALDFIAIQLENPFGTDDNDLPMSHFQQEMNSCLLMLLHENTDMIATTSVKCNYDFQELFNGIVDGGENPETNRRMSELAEHPQDHGESKDGDHATPEEEGDHPVFGGPKKSGMLSKIFSEPPAPVQVTPEQALADGIKKFEANFVGWTTSMEKQMLELKESFSAFKTFNDTTSELLASTELGNHALTSRTEGWEYAIWAM